MQKNPIGWVEIPVTDLDRAEKFYTDYFGYALERKPGNNGVTMIWFPMDEGYGSAATLIHGPGCVPSQSGTLVYFPAPAGGLEASVKKAEAQGIEILLPGTDIGEHGFFAILADSEGNRIAIHSMEE